MAESPAASNHFEPGARAEGGVAEANLRNATVLLFARVCDRLARPFDASSSIQSCPIEVGQEPLAWLAAVAPTAGFRVEARRMSLADAVWLAQDDLPIVAWSDSRGAWVAVNRHGFFKPRAWWSDGPVDASVPTTRGRLATDLGLRSPGEPADFGLLMPLDPAGAGMQAGHDREHGHGESASPVRRLMALMRPEGADLWAIGVFSAVTGLLSLALPLAVNAFISNLSFGVRSGPFVQALLAIALVLFACLALAGALRAVQHVVAEVVQRRVFARLAADLSHRLPRIELACTDGVHAPELVNRFLEVVTVQKSSALLLLTGIDLALSTVIGLTVLAFYHPFLLALSALLVVAIALIVFVGGRGAVPTSVRESIRKYEVVEWLEELARHPRIFKGPGGAELARKRADDLVRGYLQARRDHFRVLFRQILALLGLEVVAGTVLLGVGGWLVLNQQLTLGQLVAAEIIVTAIVAAVAKLGKQFEAWYDAVAAVDKLGVLVDLRPERQGGEVIRGECGASVEARGVEHRKPGRPGVAGPLDFRVEPGERVAVLASFGSGASTLLDLLAGMRTPTSGRVLVDSVDVADWDLDALHEQVMLVREGDVMSGTVAENLRLGCDGITVAQLNAGLEAVGLADAVRALPEGLQAALITGGLPLTGRQRIRLLIARALVLRPRLLLVDELLDGLDDATFRQLCGALLDPALGWTVVLVTRDPRVARCLGRAIELVAPAPGMEPGK